MKPGLRFRVARHAGFWVALWVFFLMIQLPEHFATGRGIYWREYWFIQVPLSLCTIYPLLYWFLPLLLVRQQVARFLILLAGWVVAVAVLNGVFQSCYRYVWLPWLFGEQSPWPFQWADIFGRLSFGFFAVIATGGLLCAVKGVNYWHQQRQLRVRLEQQRLRTELELLKSQLQPPFLFSTLRTLHALTLHKSPDSPAAVLHLSALLRYMLYDGQLDAVPLAAEVDMLRHYVALERLRLGPRADVALHFSGAIAEATIAPLLLLPLLENAFRHGTGPAHECPWLSIDLVAKPDSITVKVINSRLPDATGRPDGPGLRTLGERLSRLYPNRHTLKLVAEPDTFLATLHLRAARPVGSSSPASLPAHDAADSEAPDPFVSKEVSF